MTTSTKGYEITNIIAGYSNKNNPWHEWIMDNCPQYSNFIKFAGNIVRLNAESRGIPFAQAIPIYIKEKGLDFDNALDSFIAYEVFRRELTEYRLAKRTDIK